jgi:molybdopterin/thiamine biosynthesis adenylyltransferase
VNPELTIDALYEPISESNVDEFLRDVDVLVDGVDFFSFEARQLLFSKAREKGNWAITAGPIGFSTAWLAFDPAGMSFDAYFDMHDGMAPLDQFAAFAVGLAPRATHFKYIDLSYVDGRTARGPSVGLACNLASGVTAAEAAKILLNRQPLRPAPYFAQFDAYRCLLRRGRLRWGNRHPLQRLKRAILRRRMQKLGYHGDPS